MFKIKDFSYFHITNNVVKKCKKFIKKNYYLADDFATFDNLLPNCDEAMIVLKL